MTDEQLTTIDLFSGIGGFTLAAEWAGFKTVAFCEKEPFCQKVLQKRFNGIIADPKSPRRSAWSSKGQPRRCNSIPIIPEIRDFDGTKWRGATLLTGGFPCQPFSVAGQRRGKEDDRYLWPQMRRVINEAKPRWILAENVPGIFRMALDTVLADLEGEGYTVGTFIIPACGLNAPHRRNRIWIIAHSGLFGQEKAEKQTAGVKQSNQNAPNSESRMSRKQTEQKGWENSGGRNIEIIADSEFKRPISGESQGWSRHKERISEGDNSDVADSDSRRIRRHKSEGIKERPVARSSHKQASPNSERTRLEGAIGEGEARPIRCHTESSDDSSYWQEDWYEVATCFCRVANGIPDRVHRLKALGNAIVPQIAFEILKNIAWIEKHYD